MHQHLFYVSVLSSSESVRLVHGRTKNFLLSAPSDLGEVNIVNLSWEYDHDLDPLDLTKFCLIPILCSDHLFVQKVMVRKIQSYDTKALARSKE